MCGFSSGKRFAIHMAAGVISAHRYQAKKIQPVSFQSTGWPFTQAINIFLAVSGSISVIVFVYAGVMLIISQGNEEEITKFKNLLIWALVGTVFTTLSYALVRGIMLLVFT